MLKHDHDWSGFFFWLDGGVKAGVVLALLIAPFSLLAAIFVGVLTVILYAILNLPSAKLSETCKKCGGLNE